MRNEKYRYVRKVLWGILFANIAVAAVKTGIGLVCASQSILADGIHSFADGTSNIVGLIGIWLASKPQDKKHPYGHEKYEIMASLSIGLMLAAMSGRIIYTAVRSFQAAPAPAIGITEGLLIVMTILINTVVAFTEYRCGKRNNSVILITDSLHTRGDILISCAVLLGMIAIQFGLPAWIDGVMSIAVAIAVLLSAGHIIKNCVDVLTDSVAVDCNEIRGILMSVPGVYDVHKVRSRGEQSHIYIDLHVIVSPQSSAVSIHSLSHKLEAILCERYGADTDVNIHLEPDDGHHGM